MVAKLRDMASLSFLAFTRDTPTSINLKEQSLGFMGEDIKDDSIITGVYGSHSKQTALVMAVKWTREHAGKTGLNRVLMVDTNYRVDNYTLTRDLARRDTIAHTGWLNMDRMSKALREELKEIWLVWIDQDSPFGVAQRLESESFLDIAVQYPKYVRRMMDEDPSLKGIVHPVNPTLNPSACIWAASVRFEPDRFHGAEARFLSGVEVIVGEPV